MTKDLTKGRPMPQILSFGIPVLFGYLFQQLYNVVDTAIVGMGRPFVRSFVIVNHLTHSGCCSFFHMGFRRRSSRKLELIIVDSTKNSSVKLCNLTEGRIDSLVQNDC